MRHFCTYFDSNYLLRGLTLYRSLRAVEGRFVLHVLALDDATRQVIEQIDEPGLVVVGLKQIESWDARLLEAKVERNDVEYYFTLSPGLPLFLLEFDKNIDVITYLDADLYFYDNPQVIFDELGSRSILVTEHRYAKRLVGHEQYGRFNVQFQVFRRDEVGMRCLRRWHEQCLDWCFDRVEGNRYADQKYLDEWPELYGDALVISAHPGVGVAPWNWQASCLEDSAQGIVARGRPLVFFHFHGVKFFCPYFISNGLKDWGMMPWPLRRRFYADYVRDVRATHSWLRDATGVDIPIRDQFKRGKGVGVGAISEILRKAWAQSMIVI